MANVAQSAAERFVIIIIIIIIIVGALWRYTLVSYLQTFIVDLSPA